ncbi:hypothetical protein V8E36_009068 [Tilletia maclaganii]
MLRSDEKRISVGSASVALALLSYSQCHGAAHRFLRKYSMTSRFVFDEFIVKAPYPTVAAVDQQASVLLKTFSLVPIATFAAMLAATAAYLVYNLHETEPSSSPDKRRSN